MVIIIATMLIYMLELEIVNDILAYIFYNWWFFAFKTTFRFNRSARPRFTESKLHRICFLIKKIIKDGIFLLVRCLGPNMIRLNWIVLKLFPSCRYVFGQYHIRLKPIFIHVLNFKWFRNHDLISLLN